MKLLSITHDSSRTGAAISLLALFSGLKEKGVRIHVIVSEFGFLTDELEKLQIDYSILKISFNVWPSFIGYKRLLRYIKSCAGSIYGFYKQEKRLESIVLKLMPDIIHTNVSVISLGYKVAVKHGIPHIWHIREYGDLHYNFNFYPSKRVYFTNIRNSWSIAITNGIKKHYNCNERCRVIYDGVSDIKRQKGEEIIEKNFIYVGVLTPAKGATDMINAFIDFCKLNDEFSLHFYGRCHNENYEQELRKILVNTVAENRVYFHGEINNVDDVMRKAWAIVVPSRNEGFGRITAEAMFNECLVIGRNDSGTKEQFDNGLELIGEEIGFRFDSVEEMTERMIEVSQMTMVERNKTTNNARSVCERLYLNNDHITKVYDYMVEVLEKEENRI